MSLVLNVEILGEFKKLTSATQGANKQLKNMADRSKKISRGINKAFGAIGVGLSFAAIAQGFKSTTQAAQRDIKTRDLLTLAIKNNSDATDEQISQVHAYTEATELSAAVNEEELRPAFANLVRATNDVTKAQQLMEVALDVSAGTGKSLDVVTQAMGRALNGSTTALNRLVPALKNSKNPMADLAEAFKGANAEAAKEKTWERFQLILDRITDEIGHMLLPVLEDFANWFIDTYPKIEQFFKDLKKAFDDPAVQKSFRDLNEAVGRLGTSLRNLFGLPKTQGANDMITFLKTLADALTLVANVMDRIVTALKTIVPGLNALSSFGPSTENLAQWLIDNFGVNTSLSEIVTPGSQLPSGRSTNSRSGSRIYNINVNSTNATPQQIVDKIKQYEKQTGNRVLR
jgi:hypothetical protein